jgi:hypothetical protein
MLFRRILLHLEKKTVNLKPDYEPHFITSDNDFLVQEEQKRTVRNAVKVLIIWLKLLTPCLGLKWTSSACKPDFRARRLILNKVNQIKR